MVRAAYSSGTPSYGVGAGNSTMIIDETAKIEEAARNTRLSKTSDFGSGCSGRRQSPHRRLDLRGRWLKLAASLRAGYPSATESDEGGLRNAMMGTRRGIRPPLHRRHQRRSSSRSRPGF
jgi:acyl-CoA reductase-like NAD-dependent aldehyde dehydrogenase